MDVKKELKNILHKDLSKQQKTFLALYYHEDLAKKEISEVMNLTEAEVSDIHANVISFIKNRLNSLPRNL